MTFLYKIGIILIDITEEIGDINDLVYFNE